MNESVDQMRAIALAAPREPNAFVRWTSEHPELERLRLKLELSRGKVDVSVINTTRFHARVQFALTVFLAGALDRKQFSILGADFAVRTPFGVRGPDLTIEHRSKRGDELMSDKPIMIIEVLSKSSMYRDFHDKPEEYLAIDSLQAYAIFAQDDARVWIWQRQDGVWDDKAEMLAGLDKSIEIRALGVTLPLSAIYGDLDFGD